MRQSQYHRSEDPNSSGKEDLIDGRFLNLLVDNISKQDWPLFVANCNKISERFSQKSITQHITNPEISIRTGGEKYNGSLIHRLFVRSPSNAAINALMQLSPDPDAVAIRVSPSRWIAKLLPLEIAIMWGNEHMLRTLLDAGANPNILLSDNTSLLSTACIHSELPGRNEVPASFASLLQQYGATFRDTDFSYALSAFNIKQYADLSGLKVECDISNWNLSEAVLIGTDLSSAVGAAQCLFDGALYSPETKMPDNLHPASVGMHRAHYDRDSSTWGKIGFRLTSNEIARAHDTISDEEIKIFLDTQKIDWDSSTLHLLLKLVLETSHENQADVDKVDPSPLIALMPQIQATQAGDKLSSVLEAIEKQLDGYYLSHHRGRRHIAAGSHPMEPEMMAALGMTDFTNGEAISAFTRALTAQTQWIALDRKDEGGRNIPRHGITDRMALTWAELGRISLSFKKWKFDAISPKVSVGEAATVRIPSTFETFGFETTKRLSDTDYSKKPKVILPGLGTGSVLSEERIQQLSETPVTPSISRLKTFSPHTYLEVRHGYIMVSVPYRGTLLIRNSSTDFGRDRLQVTALYAPNDVGSSKFREELKDFDHYTCKKYFRSIFNRHYSRKQDPAHYHINLLLGHLLHFEECFDKWKFDTDPSSAFKRNLLGDYDLVGGYYSEGFKHVLEVARVLHTAQTNPLAFVFYPKKAVPYFPIDFPSPLPEFLPDAPAGNIAIGYLPVTEERLELLEALAHDRLTENDDARLKQSGIRDFLQEAGFSGHGCFSLTNIWPNELW